MRDALVSTIGNKPAPLVNAVANALSVRDPDAPAITTKDKPKPDPTLRDYENVPLPPKRVTHETDTTRRLNTPQYQNTIHNHLQKEVHPYIPDAWHDPTKTKIGYEIPLTRHFYTHTPPRPLHQIDNEIKTLQTQIQALLAERCDDDHGSFEACAYRLCLPDSVGDADAPRSNSEMGRWGSL